MSYDAFKEEPDNLNDLLQRYENLLAGLPDSYIEEDGFEQLINHFEDLEKYHKALEISHTASEQFPYSVILLVQQANLFILIRQYDKALQILEMAHILDNYDANIYILKMEAYLALDEEDKALDLYNECLPLFSGEEKVDLLFELSDVFDDYENYEKLFDCLVSILKIEPANEEALVKICFWTDFTGRNEESIKLHKKIIDDYPYNELAWFNLGAAYQGLRLHEKAIEAYLFVLAIDEKFEYAYRNLGDAYLRLRKYTDAIEMLNKVVELSEPDHVIYEALGHCYDKLKNYPQARKYYTKVNSMMTDNGQMQYKIACTYINEGAWQNALKLLRSNTQLHRLNPDYNLALGLCYLQIKNYDDAITYLGNVVRIRPKSSSGWVHLLNCLHEAEMFIDGLEYAQFAFDQTERKPIFLYYKAMFLYAIGSLKEALIVLENAMSINPKLIKKFIEINPSVLQSTAVVEVIARHKQRKHL